jgi:exo-beta-1,3-glucanase (GH17 family)
VHSADFGSEPIGDSVDQPNFIRDLGSFRSQMRQWGVPVGISEDWDRPNQLSGNNGNGLAQLGRDVMANSDFVHSHIMPFYHGQQVSNGNAWRYIQQQIEWYGRTMPGVPHMITESQYASRYGGWHGDGPGDLGIWQYSKVRARRVERSRSGARA